MKKCSAWLVYLVTRDKRIHFQKGRGKVGSSKLPTDEHSISAACSSSKCDGGLT